MLLNYQVHKDCCHYENISEPHYHDDYEVLLGLTDGGTFLINGHSYPLCHGMLFVLGSGVMHQCVANISSYEKIILHFPEETLRAISTSNSDYTQLFQNMDYLTLLLNNDQFEYFRSTIESCLLSEEDFGNELKRNIAFMQLILGISDLLRSGTSAIHPAPTKDYARMMPIFEYIHEHYTQEISLEELSQHFFISKYHLCRRFKALTGFTVGSYVTNYRIRQACILLRKGTSVQEAGESVGFANNAHFIRVFGKIIGKSPGKYAKSY